MVLKRLANQPALTMPIVEWIDSGRLLKTMMPIDYSEDCFTCHGNPNGILDISGYPREGARVGKLAEAINPLGPLPFYRLAVQYFPHPRLDRPAPSAGLHLRLASIVTDASTSFRTGLWSEEEPESRSDDRPTGDECCCLGDLIPLLRHGEPPHDGE